MEDNPVRAFIYDQEGNLLPFNMKRTDFSERFREWLAVHDRYTPGSGQ